MPYSEGMDHVLLRDRNDLVGAARIVFAVGTSGPSRSIHGHDLKDFAREGQDLVAVHSVQVFEEFEWRDYPYFFKGIEDPPAVLGDMNNVYQCFKTVIAWDVKKMIPSPSEDIGILGEKPKKVSVAILEPFSRLLWNSPRKVRFGTDSVRLIPRIQYVSDGEDCDGSGSYEVDRHDHAAEGHDHHGLDGQESIDQLAEDSEFMDDSSVRDRHLQIDELQNGNGRPSKTTAQVAEDEENCYKNAADDGIQMMTVENAEGPSELAPGETDAHQVASKRSAVAKVVRVDNDLLMDSPSRRLLLKLRARRASVNKNSSDSRGKKRKMSTIGSSDSHRQFGSEVRTPDQREETEERRRVHRRTSNLEVGERVDAVGCLQSDGQVASRNHIAGNGSLGGTDFLVAEWEANEFGIASCDKEVGFENASNASVAPSAQLRLPLQELDLNSRKRQYIFKNRKPASPKKIGRFQQKCQTLLEKGRDENPFLSDRDCCSSYCFENVNPEYAHSQYMKFLSMKRVERKRALTAMFDPISRKFRFDGTPVCSLFLSKGFLFSFCLQSSVKNTPMSQASSSVMACPREVRNDTKKDSIVLFLRRFAEVAGDNMPSRPHINLPSMNKLQVYEKYLEQLRSNRCHDVPTRNYFYTVWKSMCPNIKTHRHHGFTVCDLCERYRSQMHEYANNEEAQGVIRRNMRAHFDQMAEERRGYAERRELAVKFPSKYCSIILDGADQSGYGLPHFIFKTKEDRGHKLKVKCVGVLEHAKEKKLSLFTLTEEFQTGANHIIEAAHRVLNRKKMEQGRLPETLFVQADNCTRENKNRYFMAYFEMLVARGVFLEVQISFLPIGHTHTDIDQSFSSVANRLRMVDAVTMEDLLEELGNCYTPRATAEPMLGIINFSGLCENGGFLANAKNFSQYRYFRFTRLNLVGPGASDSHLDADGLYRTTCDVKHQSGEEWCPLDNRAARQGFCRRVPKLENTPPTDTSPPNNVRQINECFRSSERRINSVQKLQALEQLRDRVYTRRVDDMHWNLAEAFEMNGDYLPGAHAVDENYSPGNEDALPADRVLYTVNCFVAVQTEDEVEEPFWIARILKIENSDEEGNVSHLKVRWYQAKAGSKSVFSARYEMSTRLAGEDHVLFDDVIDVRTVLCEFESLNRSGGLHVRTQKAIRQSLAKH